MREIRWEIFDVCPGCGAAAGARCHDRRASRAAVLLTYPHHGRQVFIWPSWALYLRTVFGGMPTVDVLDLAKLAGY